MLHVVLTAIRVASSRQGVPLAYILDASCRRLLRGEVYKFALLDRQLQSKLVLQLAANAILSAGKRRARASLEPEAEEEESDVEVEVQSSQVQW